MCLLLGALTRSLPLSLSLWLAKTIGTSTQNKWNHLMSLPVLSKWEQPRSLALKWDDFRLPTYFTVWMNGMCVCAGSGGGGGGVHVNGPNISRLHSSASSSSFTCHAFSLAIYTPKPRSYHSPIQYENEIVYHIIPGYFLLFFPFRVREVLNMKPLSAWIVKSMQCKKPTVFNSKTEMRWWQK